jgi:hypothetical protein
MGVPALTVWRRKKRRVWTVGIVEQLLLARSRPMYSAYQPRQLASPRLGAQVEDRLTDNPLPLM